MTKAEALVVKLALEQQTAGIPAGGAAKLWRALNRVRAERREEAPRFARDPARAQGR